MHRPYLTREWLIEDARDAVLTALNCFASNSGLPKLLHGGATDGDLPQLFNGIDAQVDRLIARSGVIIPDEPYSEEFVSRTRRQMIAAR